MAPRNTLPMYRALWNATDPHHRCGVLGCADPRVSLLREGEDPLTNLPRSVGAIIDPSRVHKNAKDSVVASNKDSVVASMPPHARRLIMGHDMFQRDKKLKNLMRELRLTTL